MSERICHGGKKKLKNSWFYSVGEKTDFKETSEQKLTVWNIWTFFKQSNLLTSIQVSRSLLRCCFQVWYETIEVYFWKKNDSFESLFPIARFCPPKLSGSGATITDRKGRGLGSAPKPAHMKTGERFWAAAQTYSWSEALSWLGSMVDLWLQLTCVSGWCVVAKGTCHCTSLMFSLHSLHCRSHILLCCPDA